MLLPHSGATITAMKHKPEIQLTSKHALATALEMPGTHKGRVRAFVAGFSKHTALLALLFVHLFANFSFAGQAQLDAERTARLDTAFASLKKADADALASTFPGLTPTEATRLIQQIGEQWGELSKLTVDKQKRPAPDKGTMKPVVHWGTKPTNVGLRLDLRSEAASNRWLRIGMLFAKGDSQPRQFLAVEWTADSSPSAAP